MAYIKPRFAKFDIMSSTRKQKLVRLILSKKLNEDETTYLLKSESNASRLSRGLSRYKEIDVVNTFALNKIS